MNEEEYGGMEDRFDERFDLVRGFEYFGTRIKTHRTQRKLIQDFVWSEKKGSERALANEVAGIVLSNEKGPADRLERLQQLLKSRFGDIYDKYMQ